MSLRFWAVALAGLALSVAGCGTRVGTGNGGGADSSALQIVITPIGYKPTSAAGADPVAISVRSGADVILSGKDSDGGSVALITFAWTQTGGPALPALPDPGALLYRTANTVNFRAPQVATATKLSFRLTVTSAVNTTASKNIDVTVMPASDPNQFLISSIIDGPPPQKFQVVVATAQGLSGLTADVPVCVRVLRKVQYRGTNQAATDAPLVVDLPQLPALQADASWLESAGGVAAVNQDGSSNLANAVHSYTNPRLTFELPTFNDEALFAMFNQPVAGESDSQRAARVANQLLPQDVDTAKLLVSVTAMPGSCDGAHSAPDLAANSLVLAVLNNSGPDAIALQSAPAAANSVATLNQDTTGATLTSDVLLTSVGTSPNTTETLASATAYYNAIDPPTAGHPNGSKLTLDDWLDANCFDHTATDYGVGAAGANGAHAVYTNNFDLGFGRDMYFIKCAADHTDASGNVTAHQGDMASVVINYTSLEQAALKQAPFLAVAMEYSGDSRTAVRYTKFYAFAPDQRNGGFQRVSSANFDKRGQKYLPGACLSCHGGSVSDSTFAAGGNVDAAFMPWDLDALLYSDTDPSFKGQLLDGSPFTRSMQEPNLKKLNALAYQTWQVPEAIVAANPVHSTVTSCATTDIGNGDCIDRFAAPKALVEKWYGGDPSAATSTAYSDAVTPADWTIVGQTAPSDLYHQAYAHYCRSCHTENNVATKQFTSYPLFEQSYITASAAVGTTSKLIQDVVYRKTQMPAARLTADRFWVDFAGGTSAATVLAKQAETALNTTGVLVDASSGQAIAPGAPVVSATVHGTTVTDGQSVDATRLDQTRADASASFFTPGYTWNLCLYPAPAPGGAALPDLTSPGATCNAVTGLVGSNNAAPGFGTAAAGTYKLSLTPVSALVPAPAQLSYLVNVKRTDPVVSDCSVEEPVNQAVSISLANCGSGIKDGDGTNTVFLAPDQTGQVYAPPASGNPWNQSIVQSGAYSACVYDSSSGAGAPNPCPATIQPVTPGRAIGLFLNSSVSNPLKLDYELCDSADNYCAGATITVQPSSLAAAPATYLAHLPAVSGFSIPSEAPSLVTSSLGVLTAPVDAWPSTSAETQCLGSASVAPNVLSLAQYYAVKPCTDTFTLTFNAAQGGSISKGGAPAASIAIGPVTFGGTDAITFTPTSAKATCDYAGNNCAASGYSYSISSGVAGTKGPVGVSIKILAMTSFGQSTISNGRIYDDLGGSKCATCHSGTSVPAATAKWVYETTPALTEAADTVTQLTSSNCTDGTSACVNTTSPSASLLYQYPCVDTNGNGFTNHGGYTNDTAQQLSSTQCSKLLQWLTEGAQNN